MDHYFFFKNQYRIGRRIKQCYIQGYVDVWNVRNNIMKRKAQANTNGSFVVLTVKISMNQYRDFPRLNLDVIEKKGEKRMNKQDMDELTDEDVEEIRELLSSILEIEDKPLFQLQLLVPAVYLILKSNNTMQLTDDYITLCMDETTKDKILEYNDKIQEVLPDAIAEYENIMNFLDFFKDVINTIENGDRMEDK